LIAAALFGAIAICIAHPKRARFAIVVSTNLGMVPAVVVLLWEPQWRTAVFVALTALCAIIYLFAPERLRNERQPRVYDARNDRTRVR
jgi:hypothetical protein